MRDLSFQHQQLLGCELVKRFFPDRPRSEKALPHAE